MMSRKLSLLSSSLLLVFCHGASLRGTTPSAPLSHDERLQLILLDETDYTVRTLFKAALAKEQKTHDRELNLLGDLFDDSPPKCGGEMTLDISCLGDCNFTNQEGTCESKMFLYHGGPCSGVSVSRSASTCRGQGPLGFGEPVFVVVSDLEDPSKHSSMWTTVGGYFWTNYQDYPIGEGLGDRHTISVYSSENMDNLLQTMTFHAPCFLGQDLATLDQQSVVQLVGTAIDPFLQAHFEFQVSSGGASTAAWQLESLQVLTSTDDHQSLPLDAASLPVKLPLALELDPLSNQTLSILGTATAVTAAGLECSVTTVYQAETVYKSLP